MSGSELRTERLGNDASVRVAEKLGFAREREVRFQGRPTMLYALEV